MKILVDMNLSPDLCAVLAADGWSATHWSAIGDPRASDRAIFEWARSNEHIVLTHDLDFGAILAVTGADGPSVLQLRHHDVMPAACGRVVSDVLRQFERELRAGALLIVDERQTRVRVLPLAR